MTNKYANCYLGTMGDAAATTKASATAGAGASAWDLFAKERDEERYYLKTASSKGAEMPAASAEPISKDNGIDYTNATKSSSAPASAVSQPKPQVQTKVTQGQAQANKTPAPIAAATTVRTTPAATIIRTTPAATTIRTTLAGSYKPQVQANQGNCRQGMKSQAPTSTPASSAPSMANSKPQGQATRAQGQGVKSQSPGATIRPSQTLYRTPQARAAQGSSNQGRQSQTPTSAAATTTAARGSPAAAYTPRVQANQGRRRGYWNPGKPSSTPAPAPAPAAVRAAPTQAPKTFSTPRVVEKFDKTYLPVNKAEFEADCKRLGLRAGLKLSRHAC